MNKINQFWDVRMAKDNDAELLLYGVLGEDEFWSDVTSKAFADTLNSLTSKKRLTVRINSPGGNIFTGNAVYTMLKRHPAKVTTVVDGIAASAASLVAMAGDVVRMPENAMLMIHNPYTMAVGDQHEMEKTAETLAKIRETAVAVYKAKTKLSEEKIIKLMDDETWLAAQDALDLGFADEIESPKELAASVENNSLLVNGISFDIGGSNVQQILNNLSSFKNKKGRVDKMELTKEILQEKYPEIYSAVKEEGIKAGIGQERTRMQGFDKIDSCGIVDVTAIINKAKYETGAEPQEIALEVVKMQAEAFKKREPLFKMQSDAQELDNIASAEPANEASKSEKIKNTLDEAFASHNKKFERKV